MREKSDCRVAKDLFQRKLGCVKAPSLDREQAGKALTRLIALIWPCRASARFNSAERLESELHEVSDGLDQILLGLGLAEKERTKVINALCERLDQLAQKLEIDAKALFEADPAAQTMGEVILSYPGLYAVAVYRLANILYKNGGRILARVFSQLAHEKTGIEIHPNSIIGVPFVIDHGTGIVIGETAVIGDNVNIYQGVTLGALNVSKKLAKKKRHPTIEDGCVIYAHATILGGQTVIGKDSVIGGNVWITKSVPPNSLVYHKSEVKLDSKLSGKTQELIYEI